MYLCYDEAVEIGLRAYHTLEYSDSCCYAFQVASSEFKKYMENKSLPYSPGLSQQWINESKKYWKAYKLKSSRKALSVLADIMEHGYVTTSLRTKIKRIPPYTQLPNWSRILLDSYLETLTHTYGNSHFIRIRNACSCFFLFLKFRGISQPSEITHEIVKSFFIRDINISSKNTNRYVNQIKHCLIYMANRGLILKTIGLTLNKLFIPDLIIVKELPESKHNKFSRFLGVSENKISRSKTEYDMAAKQLVDIHKKRKYSSSIRKSTSQAIRDFKIFIDANSFAYSNELALEWLEYQRVKWSKGKYLTFRRILLSINEILCTGTLSTSCFSTHKPKYLLPEWGDNLLSRYLREREYEDCAVSTLNMIHSACSRFIVFLDNQGIVNEKGISPLVIKNFQLQDNHSTVEGKNAYAIKIRGFLRFLARKGLVPETLELAVSTEMAPHTSIVTTLSNDQIDQIYNFRQNANHPIELRNVAIIMLGLKMGLRTSDIVNLKLTDISWKDSSISFIQQKTGVHLKLPLPVDVGNSLYRYICEGRPKSNSQHVFIHHRAPYSKFGKANFGRLLKEVVAAHPDTETIRGFHVTRKTFASKLLSIGTPVSTIADTLGHVNLDTAYEYLATNEDKMRLCAIGLRGIEYSGGFSL
jgi:site-specific recombinase XerD